jgi:hypothetical protein
MDTIIACDIDLRKIYAVMRPFMGPDRILANGVSAPDIDFGLWPAAATVLCEIASPVSFNRGGGGRVSPGVVMNLGKWAIYNVATIAQIDSELRTFQVLVAPSDKWTMGYEIAQRHKLAKADATNKDLRECQAMIWSHRNNPKLWTPLTSYLENL